MNRNFYTFLLLLSIRLILLRKSQVCGSLSEGGIVGVEVALVHVSLLGEASDKDPEAEHDKNAFPHSRGDLIPHLLV